MRRHEDWLKQADSDLCAAQDSASSNHYEWACFQAQQAAEKALKALIISKGSESRIHSIKFLLSNLPESVSVSDQIQNAARELDKHYIPTRYPDSFSTGIPKDFFTLDDAQRAISDARKIIEFVKEKID
jgi:HEPN domain-containing protein